MYGAPARVASCEQLSVASAASVSVTGALVTSCDVAMAPPTLAVLPPYDVAPTLIPAEEVHIPEVDGYDVPLYEPLAGRAVSVATTGSWRPSSGRRPVT